MAGETTLAQPATAASISRASYNVVSANAPVKGHGDVSAPGSNEAESVVIAAFAPVAGIDHYAVAAASPQTAGATFNVTITAQNSTNATVNDNATTVAAAELLRSSCHGASSTTPVARLCCANFGVLLAIRLQKAKSVKPEGRDKDASTTSLCRC